MSNGLLENKTVQEKKCWCGGKLSLSVHPLYLQCERCGTLVFNSIIKKEELEEFYTWQNYWHDQQINVSKYPPIEERANSDFGDRIPVWYELLKKYKSNPQYLLEIGCAHGGFLFYCKQKGIPNVVGVEVDKETCNFAKNKFNLSHVINGLFPDVELPYNKYDAIVGFDVLEHFIEPVKGLKAVTQKLTEDGVCIFQTPCYRGETETWAQFRPKEHLFLFNEKNVRELYSQAGLEVIDILPGYFPDDMFVMGRKKITNNKKNYFSSSKSFSEKPAIKNILFVRIDSIGDTILASSMLPYIKQKYSRANITVICQRHIAELYESSPFVDEIIGIDKNLFIRDQVYQKKFVSELKKEKFDVCLHSTYSREPIGDLLIANVDAPIKIGFDGDLNNMSVEEKNISDNIYSNLISCKESFKSELEKHKVFLQSLEITAEKLMPTIWLTKDDRDYADKILDEKKITNKKFIVLFAGAQQDLRRYENFGKALKNYLTENKLPVIALGSKGDFEINQKNLDELDVPTLNLSGKTTIRQAAAIIEKAYFAIGTETGLAHIACAVNTPNIILLGGGHYGRFMPYSNLTTIVSMPLDCYKCNWRCKFNYAYCVKDVDPKTIEQAVNRLTASKIGVHPRLFIQAYFKGAENPLSPNLDITKSQLYVKCEEFVEIGDKVSMENIEYLIINGKYDDAKKHLFNLLERIPNDIDVLNNLAVIHIIEGDFEQAEKFMERVFSLDEKNEIAIDNLKFLKERKSGINE